MSATSKSRDPGQVHAKFFQNNSTADLPGWPEFRYLAGTTGKTVGETVNFTKILFIQMTSSWAGGRDLILDILRTTDTSRNGIFLLPFNGEKDTNRVLADVMQKYVITKQQWEKMGETGLSVTKRLAVAPKLLIVYGCFADPYSQTGRVPKFMKDFPKKAVLGIGGSRKDMEQIVTVLEFVPNAEFLKSQATKHKLDTSKVKGWGFYTGQSLASAGAFDISDAMQIPPERIVTVTDPAELRKRMLPILDAVKIDDEFLQEKLENRDFKRLVTSVRTQRKKLADAAYDEFKQAGSDYPKLPADPTALPFERILDAEEQRKKLWEARKARDPKAKAPPEADDDDSPIIMSNLDLDNPLVFADEETEEGKARKKKKEELAEQAKKRREAKYKLLKAERAEMGKRKEERFQARKLAPGKKKPTGKRKGGKKKSSGDKPSKKKSNDSDEELGDEEEEEETTEKQSKKKKATPPEKKKKKKKKKKKATPPDKEKPYVHPPDWYVYPEMLDFTDDSESEEEKESQKKKKKTPPPEKKKKKTPPPPPPEKKKKSPPKKKKTPPLKKKKTPPKKKKKTPPSKKKKNPPSKKKKKKKTPPGSVAFSLPNDFY